MHRSRLCTVVIDCKTDDIDAAARFWSQALGKEARTLDDNDANYRELKTGDDEMYLLVQKVDHPSRLHLDIETDDIEAEVKRLEALGAKRIEFVKRWWVMEAPTGQRFCVVRPQREGRLGPHANTWTDER
ncbi:VOC family protein [Hyalangium gracile]|uniref:VOC family protein n=1 Tax=Hyalangium gracile TaxID=394092 RepID=UPI001CCC535A|nr:VOC family protein [Hyalangium gracile]